MTLLYKVMLNSSIGNSLPLGQSDFGLWFSHKVLTTSAALLKPDTSRA